MDRRERYRKGLHPLYLPLYDALCAELGPEWQPYSGVRTVQEQAAIYAQGRGKKGAIVTWAKPGDSAHNYACASDWCLWEEDQKGQMAPRWPAKGAPEWHPYVQACEKVGLRPGAEFGDFPHNEVALNVSWRDVGNVFRLQGMAAADDYIREHLTK
jgi:peptidoglycan L-alanyl-D-glutamate endopeptidase CwlK